MHFPGDVGKNCCFEILENFHKNVFSKVPLKQFELADLPLVTILKTGSITNVPCENCENSRNCCESDYGGINV